MTQDNLKRIRTIAAAVALTCAATAAYAGGSDPATPQDSTTAPVNNARPDTSAPPAYQQTPGANQGSNATDPRTGQSMMAPNLQTARLPNGQPAPSQQPVSPPDTSSANDHSH